MKLLLVGLALALAVAGSAMATGGGASLADGQACVFAEHGETIGACSGPLPAAAGLGCRASTAPLAAGCDL